MNDDHETTPDELLYVLEQQLKSLTAYGAKYEEEQRANQSMPAVQS